ncbi:bifunctional 2-polyprenyl-6-hydroxyphenol methylase/3-demethylubiquinol 3-O-methyltransferase UbiG [Sediminibacter sp. Hel_I_10]|uniref:class I SAM-dependent methyltransferase n=1 Tax=Sediminibacter sp. Hel_I_10 TaxID=1392490 RepID=UPI0018CC20E5|nr:class I SAM-dependent methyltransferase [Sediminibacter sp. Hel_I_10]
MKSTLVPEANAQLIKKINISHLIWEYEKYLKIDVSEYFEGLDEIGIYQCNETQYQFFFPFDIDGNSEFYESLQNFDWYYMPWKWEHEISKNLFRLDEHILEIGSGGMGFLEKLQNEDYMVTGLELNQKSISQARKKNLNVIGETIQQHAELNQETYDIVCSYQVLEHISDVNSFLKSSIDCLKTGGKMIIAVPNNDSFIKHTEGGVLNKPPHHMGLWNPKSISLLEKHFNVKLNKIYFEPLQDYHVKWYFDTFYGKWIQKNRFFKGLLKKQKIKNALKKIIATNRKYIKGHTMLAVFTKTK